MAQFASEIGSVAAVQVTGEPQIDAGRANQGPSVAMALVERCAEVRSQSRHVAWVRSRYRQLPTDGWGRSSDRTIAMPAAVGLTSARTRQRTTRHPKQDPYMSVESELLFDIQRMPIGRGGVDDMVWPVGREELAAVGEATVRTVLEAGRDAEPRLIGDAFALTAPYASIASMALYEAVALSRRVRSAGRAPVYPPRWRIARAVEAGEEPPADPLIRRLMSGPSRSARWRTPLRWARQPFVRDGISRRPLALSDREHDVFVTMTGPVISRHAESVQDRVVFGRYEWWFASAVPARGAHVASLASDVAERLISVFEDAGEAVPSHVSRWLDRWVRAVGGLFAAHLQALESDHHLLPRRLWTGTGGNEWARLLRYATRRAGGYVTGHDHGTGAGLRTQWTHTVFELEAADEFVTFNAAQAASLSQNVRRDLLLQGTVPVIVALADGEDRGRSDIPTVTTGSRVVRRVMVVTSPYRGDHHHQAALLAEPVAVDFQARLFSNLRSWGFDVMHKPHPATSRRTPDAFSEWGVIELEGRFEDRVADAGADVIVIIDDSSSTVLNSALGTHVPTVIIDVHHTPWGPDEREMLERRAPVVDACLDTHNRVHVDWATLRAAIERSVSLRDRAFFERWFRIQ